MSSQYSKKLTYSLWVGLLSIPVACAIAFIGLFILSPLGAMFFPGWSGIAFIALWFSLVTITTTFINLRTLWMLRNSKTVRFCRTAALFCGVDIVVGLWILYIIWRPQPYG